MARYTKELRELSKLRKSGAEPKESCLKCGAPLYLKGYCVKCTVAVQSSVPKEADLPAVVQNFVEGEHS